MFHRDLSDYPICLNGLQNIQALYHGRDERHPMPVFVARPTRDARVSGPAGDDLITIKGLCASRCMTADYRQRDGCLRRNYLLVRGFQKPAKRVRMSTKVKALGDRCHIEPRSAEILLIGC